MKKAYFWFNTNKMKNKYNNNYNYNYFLKKYF